MNLYQRYIIVCVKNKTTITPLSTAAALIASTRTFNYDVVFDNVGGILGLGVGQWLGANRTKDLVAFHIPG